MTFLVAPQKCNFLIKPISMKSKLHYDPTSRKSIDAKWPAILLNFSDGNKFVVW